MSDYYRIFCLEKSDYLPAVIKGKKNAEKIMKKNKLSEPRFMLRYYAPALMALHPEHKKLLGLK